MDIILPPAPKDHATTKHLLTGCQLGILSFLGLEVLHTENTNPNQTISKKLMKSPWISQVNFPSELPSFHAGEHELRLLQHVLWDVTSYLGWIGRPSTNGAFLAKFCLNRWTFCLNKTGGYSVWAQVSDQFFSYLWNFGTSESSWALPKVWLVFEESPCINAKRKLALPLSKLLGCPWLPQNPFR
jgi:hypothetical protein